MSIVAKRIRSRREELGLSQEELAKRLGYKSKTTINKIELGHNDITQSKLVLFAKALSTTPGYLMGWEEPSPMDAALVADVVSDPMLMEALKKLIELTPEQKMKVYDYIDFQLSRK